MELLPDQTGELRIDRSDRELGNVEIFENFAELVCGNMRPTDLLTLSTEPSEERPE